MSLVCRTCLTSSDLLPLFALLEPAARSRQQHDLYRATGITIEMDDGLPQTICKTCADLVNSALHLRDQSTLAEQKLRNYGYKIKLEMTEDNETTNTIQAEKSFQYINMDNNFDASSPVIPIFNEMKDDIETKPLENMKLYSVLSNDPSTPSRIEKNVESSLKKVLISKNFENTTKSKKLKKSKYIDKIKKCEEFADGPLNTDGSIRCKICKRLCSSLSSFTFHLRIHIGFNHICEFCGKKFYAAIGLKRHCMSWHGLEKDLSCAHCHYRATCISRLREHERTHTGEKPFECAECGGKFHTRSSIIQHLRLHVDSKTVQCDKCPSMFKNRRALTTHISQSHVRDFLYLCYLCDKRYSKNTTARKHLSKFHGVPRGQQGKIPRFSLSRSAVVN